MDLIISTEKSTHNSRTTVTILTGNKDVNNIIKGLYTNEKPARNIEAYDNKIDPDKVRTRPSYVNAIMIQSRGLEGETCAQYARNSGRGPFVQCIRVKGHFGGCCGNYKWRDHVAKCSMHTLNELDDDVIMVEGKRVIEVE
ncbi:hypothetical protein BKA67DRAFT_538279 [Truncatella angustata]|uniref:Uncharacterized protein n=1 Tax=Truncatella angustata TaxID=152316 RepID=A0A9P8ZWZ3_9PEZI|nr:uncharacterized protein BKA67DRAFT_538279 [Truncatella angustata]KAH6652473.1 hypothetical protein BKA67DRAFT_538279 [Truncatella angustata]